MNVLRAAKSVLKAGKNTSGISPTELGIGCKLKGDSTIHPLLKKHGDTWQENLDFIFLKEVCY